MAKCINCGLELFETSRFCPNCGTPVFDDQSDSAGENPEEYEENNHSEEGLPDVNTAELTPEEEAAVLEMEAEKILEDIPPIKKIDEFPAESEKSEALNISEREELHKAEHSEKQEEIKENIPEEESPNPSVSQKPAEEKKREEAVAVNVSEEVNIPVQPQKKSKAGIIAVIAVLAVAVIGGAVFFITGNNEPIVPVEQTETIPEVTMITEITEETAAEQSEADTEISSETAETSVVTEPVTVSEEAVTETSAEVSDTAASESEASNTEAAEGMHTPEELIEGIIIEPEHKSAMGGDISAEISLSAEGLDSSVLGDGVLFITEYTSPVTAPENITPAVMVITINETPVSVNATSCSEGMIIFEYEMMRAAAEEAGFTADDIDSVAVKSTGAPIDVFKITVMKE